MQLSRSFRLLAAAAAVAGVTAAGQAQVFITITTDTATQLSGSFSATGFNFSQAVPVNFASLPSGGAQKLYLSRSGFEQFFPLGTGTPDDPHYNFAAGAGLALGVFALVRRGRKAAAR